jgi:membrane-associated protease RseP (regulator of RpoE activity)
LGEQGFQKFEADRAVLPPAVEVYPVQGVRGKPAVVLPVVLFICTVFTTLLAGVFLQLGFLLQAGQSIPTLRLSSFLDPQTWLLGAPFSIALLAILLAHEMGHFLMCRHYGIDATYPYVIPAPPMLNFFGTFGAVIRIKSPFGNPTELFDVGIAGPIAGFVVLVPALLIGLKLSTPLHGKLTEGVMEFGEPLLFKWSSTLVFYSTDVNINLHPIGWAAWFGILATSINLLPIGQLDGGHVVYALFGPRAHRWVSRITFVSIIALAVATTRLLSVYLVFALVLLFLLGLRHPAPLRDDTRIDRGRFLLAVFGLVILVITFMPIPVRVIS